jgi:site-specific recombinase XerD
VKDIPLGVNECDSLKNRIKEAIDSADQVAAALIEAKSKGGQTPIAAVATYCDGDGFFRDYYEYLNVEDRNGRFFIYLNHFDALKEVYEKAGGDCSRRKLKNVSKKYKNQHKKLPSYSDGDITIVRAKSKERLSDALYYRRVFYEEGKYDIYFPLKGEVLSECYKQAKQIRCAYDDFGFSLVDLLRKFHPKSKLLRKLEGLKIEEVEVDEPVFKKRVVKKRTLKKAIEEHILSKEKKRPNTIRQVQGILNRFSSFIGDKYIEDITEEDVEGFLAAEAPENSYNHFLTIVNGLFRREIKQRHIRFNPCFSLDYEERESEEVAVLSCEECVALLNAARELYDGEMLPYVALIIFAALRPDSEMRYISWKKINLEEGEIRVTKGKLKKKRKVVISANLILWLKICDQSRPIYPTNFKRKWAAVRRAAGFRGGTKVTNSKKTEVIKQKKAEELARKPWVKDFGRHSGISCHVREGEDSGKTATWAGTSTKMIVEHYDGLVTGSFAKKFWAIVPE